MTNKKEDKKRDPVAIRLDAIIRLLMDGQRPRDPDKKITLAEQVLMLHDIGLTDTEIGIIIGYQRKNVAAIRTNAKKAKKK